MKRLFCIFISLAMLISIVSCSGRKAEPPKESGGEDEKSSEEKLDKKEGEKLINDYLKALMVRDSEGVKMFYSQNFRQKSGNFTFAENPHPNGFKADSLEDKDGKLEGKVTLLSISSGQPYFSSDESTITVIKEKGMYVIDKIEPSKSMEILEKEKTLYMKEEGDVKGKEVLKIDEVPQYATPQGGVPGQKFSIGREGFGPIAGDVEGKKLAVSTTGKYPAVLIMDIKEKQLKPVDIYFDATIQSMAWSQDGKHIAVEMSNPSGARYINVYDAEKGTKIDDPMKNMLKPDKFSVNTPYWISENELVFNVSTIGNVSPSEQKNAGSYKLDIKNTSLTRY